MRATILAPLCVAAVSASAVLLFWMEPLFAKMVLPSMGGAAAVWVTALMFYQAVLLLGYVYAHLSSRRLSGRAQVMLHALLLVGAAAALPVTVPGLEGLVTAPTLRMLAMLAVGVGLPLFALSATAPLVQVWFSRSGHPNAADPYFLYAGSNLGSLGALLAFPLLVEPFVGIRLQTLLWAALFAGTAFLILGCGAAVMGAAKPKAAADQGAGMGTEAPARWKWLVLSAVPSSLLSGTTTIISTDIAPGPLLWVVPLALYLLTFILTFGERRVFPTRLLLRLQALLLVPVVLAVFSNARVLGEYFSIAALLSLLLVTGLLCHRRLYQSRPVPTRLTEFYLIVSVGGLLGGCFNALVAPLLFSSVSEYPLALVAALLLRPRLAAPVSALRMWWPPVALAGLLVALKWMSPWSAQDTFTALMLTVPVAIAFAAAQPARFAAMLLTATLALPMLKPEVQVHAVRNFYGVLRVVRDGGAATIRMVSGTTLHGMQNVAAELRREPTLYYARSGPLGDVFQVMAGRVGGDAVTMIGLGVGTVACYAPGDARWTFVDVNPEVVRLATDPSYFSFLRDCQPQAELVVGDGRLALSQATGDKAMIVLDAFSSDSVPLHLITREAMALYLSHLAADGVIAAHISNHYLDLQPQFAASAAALGVHAVTRKTHGDIASHWVVLTRSSERVAALKALGWTDMSPASGEPWTDDRSDLLSALLRRWFG